MNKFPKAYVKWASHLLCLLVLALFVAACGNTGGEPTTGGPSVPTPTPTPSPTPTPAPSVYTGDGYTVSYYPDSWASKPQSNYVNFASVSDPFTVLRIGVAPASSAANLSAALKQAVSQAQAQYPGLTQDMGAPATVTAGGTTWQQAAVSGNYAGQRIENIVLVDQHPMSTGKYYVMTLTTKADSYDQAYSKFKGLVSTFKYTS